MDCNLAVALLALLSVISAAPHLPLHLPAASYSGQVILSAPVLRTQYHTQDGLGQYFYGYSNGDGHYKAESKALDGTVVGHYGYDMPGTKHLHVAYQTRSDEPKVALVIQPVAAVVSGGGRASNYVADSQDKTRYVDVYKQAVIVTDPVPLVPAVEQTQEVSKSSYGSEDSVVQEQTVQSRPLNQYGSETNLPIDESQSYYSSENKGPSSQSKYSSDASESADENLNYQSSQAEAFSNYAADSYNAAGVLSSVSANAYAGGSAVSVSGSGPASVQASQYPTETATGVYAPIPEEVPAVIPGTSGGGSSDQRYLYSASQGTAQQSAQTVSEQGDQNSYYASSQNADSNSGYGVQSLRPLPLSPEENVQEDESSYRQQDTASVSVHQSVPANENSYHLTAPVPKPSRNLVGTYQQSSYSEASASQAVTQSSITSSNVELSQPNVVLSPAVPSVAVASVPGAHAVASVPGAHAVAAAPGVQAVASSPNIPVVLVKPDKPKNNVAVTVQHYGSSPVGSHVAVPVVPAALIPVTAVPVVPVVPVVQINPGQVITHTQESSSFSNQSSSQSQHQSSSVSIGNQGIGPLQVAPHTVITQHASSQKQESSSSHSSKKVSFNVVHSSSSLPPLVVSTIPPPPAPVSVQYSQHVVVPLHTSVNVPVQVSPIVRKTVSVSSATPSPMTAPPASYPPPPVASKPAYYDSQVVQQNPVYPENDEQDNIAEEYPPARNRY